MDLNNRKWKIIHTPPSEESHPVIDPFGKTVQETGDKRPNLNTTVKNKIWYYFLEMEKVQWNSIENKQNGIKYSKNDKSSTLSHTVALLNNKNVFIFSFYLRYEVTLCTGNYMLTKYDNRSFSMTKITMLKVLPQTWLNKSPNH